MKRLILIVGLLTGSLAQAQISSGFESVIAAGQEDANTIMDAYMNPAMEGLVYAMNGGWYHSAKTHKKLGFDLTIAYSGAMVPEDKELFAFSELEFNNMITANPDLSPTAAGGGEGALVTVMLEGTDEEVQFRMPQGAKDELPFNAVPAPILQASVGLIYDTDVIVRFVPEVGSDDIKGSQFGAGLKHNLMQYLGPLDNLPLNISVLGAFSTMNVDYDFTDGEIIAGDNQRAEFKLNSFTVQALASLDFPIVSVYGGLGYAGGSSSLKVLGTYEIDYEVAGVFSRTETFVDPIDLDYDPSGVRATLGARLNLAFFKLFADYTLQEYNTLTAGIAFSFR
ncbi:DUF6588 family protein [Croceiramulus getboli]|nr:hypothetical protein P8624_07760 [Flavobacteriaceae bacterium YJPT1-3]